MIMPKWLKKAVFYEIYPQSFYDSNGDGIGDIQGVIEKLDYIKGLGVDAVWFNPWYDSPFRDAGYDVTDFYKVAPRYGTNADAKRLFKAAHEKGLKIVLDLVSGHTSLECEWFKKSCELKPNKYSDYYVWCPQLGYRGSSSWDDYFVSGWCQRGSYLANFFAVQPALNYGYAKIRHPWELRYDDPRCEATRNEMIKVMRFWMDMGADGFRVDMAPSIIKRDKDQRLTIKFWQGVRKMFDRDYPENVLISEWFNPERALKAGFHIDFPPSTNLWRSGDWMTGEGVDPAMTATAENEHKDPAKPIRQLTELIGRTRRKGYVGFFTGNHDNPRLSFFGSPENTVTKIAMLLTFPGCPFIYYGDEIGMRYQRELPSKEGGDARTGSRTPMQWDCKSKNCGFSSAPAEKLYLPVDKRKGAPCAASALAGKNIIYNETLKLIALRKKYAALDNDAAIETVYLKRDTMPVAYVRSKGKQRLLVVINSSAAPGEFRLRGIKSGIQVGGSGVTLEAGGTVKAAGRSYGIFRI